MTRLHPLQLILFLLLLLAAACRSTPAPAATVAVEATTAVEATALPTLEATATTPPPTSTPLPPTVTPQPSPSATATPSGPSESGVAIVDRLIAAAASGDPEALRPFFQFVEAPCTTASGLGGPPKCADGQAEGTPVEVLPIWGPEGTYLEPQNLNTFLQNLQLGSLYAAYRVPQPGTPPPAYEPPGDYGVLFAGVDPAPPVILLLDDAGIVRIWYRFSQTPASVLEETGGELLLGPP